MPSFIEPDRPKRSRSSRTSQTTSRPRPSGPYAVPSVSQSFSHFPHPAARMFGHAPKSDSSSLLDENCNSNNSSNNNSFSSNMDSSQQQNRLSTMMEEEEGHHEEGGGFGSDDSAMQPQQQQQQQQRIDFSGLGKAMQANESNAEVTTTTTTASPLGTPPTSGKNRTTSGGLRNELKTITSGRALTSFESSTGSEPYHAIKAATTSVLSSNSPTPQQADFRSSTSNFNNINKNADLSGDTSSAPSSQSSSGQPLRRFFPKTLAHRIHSNMSSSVGGNSHNSSSSYNQPASSSSMSSPTSGSTVAGGTRLSSPLPHAVVRRYQIGETVLVINHHSNLANLVNQYGFPPGEGISPEEQRGPYKYVLATIEHIHYDEFAVYYTVMRADTGHQQRADAQFMSPIATEEGEAAAQRAATKTVLDSDAQGFEEDGRHANDVEAVSGNTPSSLWRACGAVGVVLFFPLVWVARNMAKWIRPVATAILNFARKRAVLILNGEDPYACQIRWTAVNYIVLCTIWYIFIDQARLAFFPHEADDALAIINFVVWVILVLELLFECFIRPDGYRFLILSDKAFAPDIVRHINAVHLAVESLSLVVFIPEFYCLFTGDTCGTRYRISFHHAILLATTAPTNVKSFFGRAFLAMIRLRVFGLVRHWRNMWINNAVLHRQRNRSAILNNLFPAQQLSKKEDGVLATPDHHLRQHSRQGSLSSSHTTASIVNGSPGGVPGEIGNHFQHLQDTHHHIHSQHAEETLTNASTIGTALMVTNSYRSLATLWIVLGLFPLIFTSFNVYSNRSPQHMTEQLEASYELVLRNPSDDACRYWDDTVRAWTAAMVAPDNTKDLQDPYLLSLEVDPPACQEFIMSFSYIMCEEMNRTAYLPVCNLAAEDPNSLGMAKALGLRAGSVVKYESSGNDSISIVAFFDQTYSIETGAQASVLVQFCMLLVVLGGLSVMRRDAEVLVLGPLRRMLKIVARYAKNPLSQPKLRRRYSHGTARRKGISKRSTDGVSYDDDTLSDSSSEFSDDDQGDLALGSYETEQLITAVTVITDLLRKCWGVAGADIISTNLASTGGALTEVFNPTVPGKSVYALFGFAAINGFDHAMRSLGDDLIDLINNVAKVLHEEIFRWGFGDSGQCNKNLGSAFLMVFRIGLVKEVIQKLEQAQDVIFSGTKAAQEAVRRRVRHKESDASGLPSSMTFSSPTQRGGGSNSFAINSMVANPKHSKSWSIANHLRRKAQRNARNKAMSLNLASLPGISTFTDRAVIGMLKSFACMYRDKDIRKWNKDFRLGAGVGAFTVSIFYGMDAGWAVEGAVGSQYKIDATYLSPHVNMASRMMSACKQYGVSILLSQAVQELMSDTGRSKLRHLDTVTVKGSSVKQKIFTYDARHKGVDFFLFGRSDEQADMDADRYSQNIWNTDQDLKAMRQHITEDFMNAFTSGHKAYLSGDWPHAIKRLERANEVMIEGAVEQGYLEDEFDAIQLQEGEDAHEAAEELKRENGDGPSQYLINFMKSHGGVAPRKWEGWHPLNRK